MFEEGARARALTVEAHALARRLLQELALFDHQAADLAVGAAVERGWPDQEAKRIRGHD